MEKVVLFIIVALSVREDITAAVIISVAVLISLASRFILNFFKVRLASRTKTDFDDMIVAALTLPLMLGIIMAGTYIALNQLTALDNHRDLIRTDFVVGYIVIGTMAVGRVINVVLTWYGQEIATKTKTELDEKLIPVLRRIVTVVVYLVGLVIILDRFGVEISPIIAGLGIGGLAVALAIQPSLNNFLAGTYVMSDGLIKKGDYIEMDNGTSGFVEEIGWRTTKLRHWQGNMIIMPNSRLSEAIVTDYEKPDTSLILVIACGVSYSSDLKKVEEITLDVASKIINDCPCASKDFAPVVRYNEFADSNINFAVVMKAVDRGSQFLLKHEFIKALHERFNREGIEIQYPVRKLYFADGQSLALNKADLAEITKNGNPS